MGKTTVSVGGIRAVMMCARWLLLLAMASMACSQTVEEGAREFLKKFDEDASNLVYQYSLASWAYNTDISQENADKEVGVMLTDKFAISFLGKYGLNQY